MKVEFDDSRLRGIVKERMAVQQIKSALVNYPMVILSGPRKVGKTIALLQIAKNTPNAEYIDCGKLNDIKRLKEIFYAEDNVLLLIDEIQKLPDCQEWVQFLSNKANNIITFRAVCTGSVVACMEILSRGKAGGGRSKYIHIPILTYLEYLYFTNVINDYNVDLYQVSYGDSFYDYMRLKGAEFFNIGPADSEFIERTAEEMYEANKNTGVSSSLLDTTVDDIKNAFILLSYRLAKDLLFRDIFYTPKIGNIELQMQISDELKRFKEFDKFSVIIAAESSMSDQQIARALRYLLWNGIVLYEYITYDYEDTNDSALTTLFLGREEAYTQGFIQKLFSRGSDIFVLNPLFYSVLSDELFKLLNDIVKSNNNEDSFIIEQLRQKLSSRTKRGFLADRNVLGIWVECYLKGAFSRMTTYPPFRTKKFNDPAGREVDLVGS